MTKTIRKETEAQLAAIVYCYGGNHEELMRDARFVNDMDTIIKKHTADEEGMEFDIEFGELIEKSIDKVRLRSGKPSSFAKKLMKKRYNINL